MRRALLSLVVLVVLAVPASTPAAPPPPTVIDFNDVQNKEGLNDKYAGRGVAFGPPARFSLPPTGMVCGSGPEGRVQGISGGSASIQCRGRGEIDPDRAVNFAMELETTRHDVRFNLQQRARKGTLILTVRAYDLQENVIDEQQVALPENVTRPVVVDHGSPAIAYIVVFGALDVVDDGDVLLDDLTALFLETGPPPAFRLTLPQPSLRVVEAGTGEVPVSIRRFNGSSGPVTLNATPPTGVRNLTFDPNPVPGRDPSRTR